MWAIWVVILCLRRRMVGLARTIVTWLTPMTSTHSMQMWSETSSCQSLLHLPTESIPSIWNRMRGVAMSRKIGELWTKECKLEWSPMNGTETMNWLCDTSFYRETTRNIAGLRLNRAQAIPWYPQENFRF